MRLSLTTAQGLLDRKVFSFRGIVPELELGGVEQDAQNLRIGHRGPSREEVERDKHHKPAQQAAEEIERGPADDERKEKQLPLGAPDRERLVDGLVDRVKTGFVGHKHVLLGCAITAQGQSQLMKLTAPIAMPMPKTIPASILFDSPSPKANMRPPTTMATRLKPRAIGPVKAA